MQYDHTSMDLYWGATPRKITKIDDIKLLTIEVGKYNLTSVYKASNSKFAFEKPVNFDIKSIHFIIEDFNSQHSNGGYDETESNGHHVEVWLIYFNILFYTIIFKPRKIVLYFQIYLNLRMIKGIL